MKKEGLLRWLPLIAWLVATAASAARVEERIELTYVEAAQLEAVLGAFAVELEVADEGRTLVLRGPRPEVEAAAEVVRRLDTPAPDERTVVLEVDVLVGGGRRVTRPPELPPELAAALEPLRPQLGAGPFELAASLELRSEGGAGGESEGDLGGSSLAPARYRLELAGSRVLPGGEPPVVRCQGLGFHLHDLPADAPGGEQREETAGRRPSSWAGLRTDVDLRVGEKTVVGKAVAEGVEAAVVLVVEARVE